MDTERHRNRLRISDLASRTGSDAAARGVRPRAAESRIVESFVSVEKSSLPRISPDVVWTSVADGAVLFCVSRELYYGANQVAAFVWQQLESSNLTFEALCETVKERFPDADAAEVRQDVRELLDDFERNGLVIATAA